MSAPRLPSPAAALVAFALLAPATAFAQHDTHDTYATQPSMAAHDMHDDAVFGYLLFDHLEIGVKHVMCLQPGDGVVDRDTAGDFKLRGAADHLREDLAGIRARSA